MLVSGTFVRVKTALVPPERLVQSTERVPFGRPSSETKPGKMTGFVERLTIWSGPGLTRGGWLVMTVKVTGSDTATAPWLSAACAVIVYCPGVTPFVSRL